jgi:hypothetical protein
MDLLRNICAPAAVLAGIYLLLAQSVAALEIIAAAGAGILGSFAVRALLKTEPVSFGFGLRWSRSVLLLPYQVFRDSLLVFGALPRLFFSWPRHVGAFHDEFPAAVGPSPEAATQRALSVLAISMPPNSYVVDVSGADGRERIHRLVGPRPAHRARSG